MASFRTKPNGGIDKDAPVASTPRAMDAPPPVETKPLEPIDVESPVEKAAQNALKQRIEEMERAEQLTRESSAPQPPPEASPPPQQQAPQVPAAVQKFLSDNPQYLRDAVAQAELNLATQRCVRDGLTWTDDNFIPTVERYLRLASDANHRRANGGSVEAEPRQAPQLQRQAPALRSSIPYSAPPTREAPSLSTGRSLSRPGPLTAEEREVARSCGLTDEQYSAQKERGRRLGTIGGGNGQ